MISRLSLALFLAIMPVAPASAIVMIDVPPRAEPQFRAPPADKDPEALPEIAIGEFAAALAGLFVLAVTLLNRRQPHSISA
jgi:hypothetical protein